MQTALGIRRMTALLVFAKVSAGSASQADAEKITVHIVPHTHDDVGWLKTVDEYYAGQNNSIQHANVKMILDTLVDCLAANLERTFTYVEQAFFQRWWRQQSSSMRERTKQLIKRGQLEFTNGGWCMHDEAAPFYLDMIDQTTLGHKFLMDEFGVAPKTGWQLDPFGHSATQAALLSSEVGFAGLFFGRIDYQDLSNRLNTSAAEFVWRASPSLGVGTQIFSGLTGEYHGNYGPPPGFNWDVSSDDEPVQDDKSLENYNVPSRVNDFVTQAKWQASVTRGNHIMWTMGSDFQYEDAREWYENLDRIIKYVNMDGRVQAVYSTPERYLLAKAQERTVTWPLKTDDFFPYADGPHQFWSGYFTSRPTLKRYIRETSAFLQVARQASVLLEATPPSTSAADGLEKLSEAMGVAQHHDAVSGTAKQHVTFDYERRLAAGRAAVVPALSASVAATAGLAPNAVVGDGPAMEVCELRNISICAPTQVLGSGVKSVDFVVWNGLAQERDEIVEVPVGGSAGMAEGIGVRVLALDSNGGSSEIPSQLVPSLPSVTNYGREAGGSAATVLFKAMLPSLGFQAYRAEVISTSLLLNSRQPVEENVLENDHLALLFCNGVLCKLTDKKAGVSTIVQQSWFYYNGSTGDAASSQHSGAYIFRPKPGDAIQIGDGKPVFAFVRGEVASEVHQTFTPWLSQRIRLARDAKHVEISFTVGQIPIEKDIGKEVISRISTDLQNAGACFTDSNGREMLPRQRDFRPTWKLNQTEPIAGNYFPVVSAVSIRDSRVGGAQLTLLTDATQGGSGCVRDGELEVMVHRRLLVDDGRGVGEPLNETQFVKPYTATSGKGSHYGPGLVTRGRHILTFTGAAGATQAARVWRPLADGVYMPPLPLFVAGGAKITKGHYSALRKPLPSNVQIVSLSWWDSRRVLLRLAHQFGLDEDSELSKPVDVDLSNVFATRRILAVDERGLAGTISREEVIRRRVPWKVEGDKETPLVEAPPASGIGGSDFVVTLGPLQVRTFLLVLDANSEGKEDMIAYV
eukprot:TRINITY_DN14462_c0_g1_i1.p1 TRINITY_DN14462_c0_g1~~TRINITY_DN14462_c0_g1_i1.p1  ORF type:complete len:1029 (-),score=189.34 TRINITY_DN14462_c0_g1_i1:76-3162(-)